MNKTDKILIISGPTASGKSALAKIIAEKLNGIIINADSMQLYQELPILSSQPNAEDLKTSEHFLYSIFKYDQDSSVAIWLSLVKKIIDENKKSSRPKLPIIVGGTGLYISKILDGISVIPEITPQIKNQSRKLYEEIGKTEFIKNLIALGEIRENLETLDKQRLIRHFEVLTQTGKTLNYWNLQPNSQIFKDENFIHINLNPPREILYQNCNLRFQLMLENGAIDEVKNLAKLNPDPNLPIIKTIGYIEINQYLQNIIDKNQLIEKASQKTRNYAKRQLTWFRNQFQNQIICETPKIAFDKILTLFES